MGRDAMVLALVLKNNDDSRRCFYIACNDDSKKISKRFFVKITLEIQRIFCSVYIVIFSVIYKIIELNKTLYTIKSIHLVGTLSN